MRSTFEHLCAQAGFAPRAAYEIDDLPAAQVFVAAGIGLVPMHGLTLATVPAGAVARPLAERPAGSRVVEALMPARARTPAVDELGVRLSAAARAHTVEPAASPAGASDRRGTAKPSAAGIVS